MTFKERLLTKPGIAISAALLLAVGGGAAAVASHCGDRGGRVEAMAPGPPVAIGALAQASQPLVGGAESVVTVRGRIAQVFGGQFVLTDGSGQVLVDTGRRRGGGDAAGAAAFAVGQTLIAQGRYEDGVLRARYLVGPDGRVAALGGGGRHGRGGHEGGGGERGRDGGAAPVAARSPVAAAPAPAQNAAAPAENAAAPAAPAQ